MQKDISLGIEALVLGFLLSPYGIPMVGAAVIGGKDSAVMMQLLAKQKSWCNLIVTPCSPAAHHLAAFNGHPTYIIKRQFDRTRTSFRAGRWQFRVM